MRKVAWVAVPFLIAGILVGCGKDESPTAPEQKRVVPQVVTVHGPNSQNVPPAVAGPVRTVAVLGNLGQTFAAAIQNLDPTRTGDTYVWSYTNGPASYTITANESSQGISWQVKVTGTYEDQQVTNFLAVRGFSSTDGATGWWESYDPSTGERAVRYEWTTDEQGIVRATLTVYGDPVLRFEILNRTDGSGSLIQYEGDIKRLEATWQANGSGSYVVYDDNGNVAAQGNWT